MTSRPKGRSSLANFKWFILGEGWGQCTKTSSSYKFSSVILIHIRCSIYLLTKSILGMIHMKILHENCPMFKTPHSSCPSMSKIFPPPWPWTSLDVQFQTPLPFQMVTSQLKENIIQQWILYIIKFFLQFGFHFQYQLMNLVWLSFHFFFILLNPPHYLLFRGFILLYVQLLIVCNYSHF